jgi:hypothetical protein
MQNTNKLFRIELIEKKEKRVADLMSEYGVVIREKL